MQSLRTRVELKDLYQDVIRGVSWKKAFTCQHAPLHTLKLHGPPIPGRLFQLTVEASIALSSRGSKPREDQVRLPSHDCYIYDIVMRRHQPRQLRGHSDDAGRLARDW